MGKFEGRIGLIPCSVFFYCLGFQIGVLQSKSLLELKKLMAPPPPPLENQRIRGARVAWVPKKIVL